VAVLLAGCGGSDSTATTLGNGSGPATIGGTISGVSAGTKLLLVNNGSDIIAPNGSGNFTFDDTVQAGGQYNVTLFTQPSGLNCTIANAQGATDQNADAVTNIAVNCQNVPVAIPTYNIGVMVSGLAVGGSMTLQLYGAHPLTVNHNGLAVFPYALSPDQVNPSGPAVAISTNPTGQTCTLSGTQDTADDLVLDSVTCQ